MKSRSETLCEFMRAFFIINNMEKGRTIFANTINEIGQHANLSANECEKFGMTWGCKTDCPVFERGECKDSFAENLAMFIKDNEYCKEEAMIDIEKYKSKFKNKEYKDLCGLANVL